MGLSRTNGLLAVDWSLVTASLLFVAARFYCKFSRRLRLWWDDLFVIISWVSEEAHALISIELIVMVASGSSHGLLQSDDSHDPSRLW
jgi:hypothetical protein